MKKTGLFFLIVLSAAGLRAQDNPFPAFPPDDVTCETDCEQMKWQLGLTFAPRPEKNIFYREFLSPKFRSMGTNLVLGPLNPKQPNGNWTWLEGESTTGPLAAGRPMIVASPANFWTNYVQSWEPGGGYLTGADFYGPLELHDLRGLTAENWPERRQRIFEEVQRELYGFIPEAANRLKIEWSAGADSTGTAEGVAFREYRLSGTIDVSGYPSVRHAPVVSAVVRMPSGRAAEGRIPLIIGFGESIDEELWGQLSPLGIAVAAFSPHRLQPDNGAFLTSYLIGLVNRGNWRKPDDWGTLVAWSWGVGRLIDYFETHDTGIDPARIGLTGHSRYGKAALVAMAYEPRLAIAFPNSSGALGVAPSRRHWGQDLEHATGRLEYHWLAGNFLKYMGVHPSSADGYMPRKVLDLKVDAESLLALCAPRPVFVGNGSEPAGDAWADPYGQYLACVAAGPVYELLGGKGIRMCDSLEYRGAKIPYPKTDKAYLAGDIGYRRHRGGHTHAPNYSVFALFVAKYLLKEAGEKEARTPEQKESGESGPHTLPRTTH